MKKLLNIAKMLLYMPILAIGVIFFVWGCVCYGGGPDAQVWHPLGLLWWLVCWLIAASCAIGFILLNNRKRWSILTAGILYEMLLLIYTFGMTISLIIQTSHETIVNMPYFFNIFLAWIMCSIGVILLFRLKANQPQSGQEKAS